MDRLGALVAARGLEELPPFLTALGVAEQFFKFHSFSLELLAFLAVLAPLRALYGWALHRIWRGQLARG